MPPPEHYALLRKLYEEAVTQLHARSQDHSAMAAFATAAMRSPITGHVFLRGDIILVRNNRFREMQRSQGGPWRAADGMELPTLTEVVRRQSGNLEAGAEVARYSRSDGERVFEVRTERIGQARSLLVAATVLDVSAVANAARANEAARSAAKLEALQEASRKKDEFLGMLSHELRNPLAPIRNSVYILERVDGASEQGRRARQVLQRQVAHLARLVDDLLDVTRIERGKFEIRRQDVDVAALLRRTAEDHQALLQQRGIALQVEAPGEPVVVIGDDARLAQVIGNLLHNAAKFTAGGGEVWLSLSRAEGTAELRVRDTGIGMDGELLRNLFEPFTQARQPLARTAGGLGLGLVLVKGVVELHGGTVHAASEGPGKGSEFLVRLPLATAPQPPPGEMAAPPRPRAGGVLRVLVVEDNVDAAASLGDLLRTLDHEVEVVHDGRAAVRSVRASRPDVVLCDIGLPGMSGYDVARALRAVRGGPMRLIAVSGYARPEDVQLALDAGFDAHVAKPCDPENIKGLLG